MRLQHNACSWSLAESTIIANPCAVAMVAFQDYGNGNDMTSNKAYSCFGAHFVGPVCTAFFEGCDTL